MDDLGGVWRTIGGRRVFIKDGQSLSEAMRESGKFDINNTKYKYIENYNDEIVQELQVKSDEVYKQLRDEEIVGGLISYSEEYYQDINYYLRESKYADNDEEYQKFIKELTNNIDNSMSKFDLEDDIVVYKGTKFEYYKTLKVGATFEMKEFNSTSLLKNVANTFKDKNDGYCLEIRVPSKTKCVYLGNNSANVGESELLLNRGLKYKVISKDDNKMILDIVK